MRLLLLNPRNPTVALTKVRENRLNRYRVWKPLGLLVLGGVTPSEWEITLVDENVREPDYDTLPKPDVVGITAFTSQASRAYELATRFKEQGIPVIMGGIHASMQPQEALRFVDSVVTGEADEIWPGVLEDARDGKLQRTYHGTLVDIERVRPARHDLLPNGYAFGSVQTTRGCPLDCHFCSVTAFNGRQFRWRPVEDVVEEFKRVHEKLVLIVDDNLIGTSRKHIERSKQLFQAIIDAKLDKRWICQATANMGEDEELVRLAAQAGCFGVFIGFESPSIEGLTEINKKFNIRKKSIRESCRCLQRHGIGVNGSFIIGLDVDRPGIGRIVADAAMAYGVDSLTVTMMTPLPGTRLWNEMERDERIAANRFPEDWKYYTLALPVAHHMHLSWEEMLEEWIAALERFYTLPRIMARGAGIYWRSRKLFGSVGMLITNLIYRRNIALDRRTHRLLDRSRGVSFTQIQSQRPFQPVADHQPAGEPALTLLSA